MLVTEIIRSIVKPIQKKELALIFLSSINTAKDKIK